MSAGRRSRGRFQAEGYPQTEGRGQAGQKSQARNPGAPAFQAGNRRLSGTDPLGKLGLGQTGPVPGSGQGFCAPVYLALVITREGNKGLLGLWAGESEGARFHRPPSGAAGSERCQGRQAGVLGRGRASRTAGFQHGVMEVTQAWGA